MPKAVDLTGQQFGKLTVKTRAGSSKDGKAVWECECECGATTYPTGKDLRLGKTKSCKSCSVKGRNNGNFKHGGQAGTTSVEYQAWQNMRKGEEIDHCPAWEDFQQFFKDIGWRPSPEHELGKHDVREPHGPTNTYWRNEIEEREYRLSLRMCDEFVINMRNIIADTGAGASVGTGEETQGTCTWNPPPQGDRATAKRPWIPVFTGQTDDADLGTSRCVVA